MKLAIAVPTVKLCAVVLDMALIEGLPLGVLEKADVSAVLKPVGATKVGTAALPCKVEYETPVVVIASARAVNMSSIK